VTVAVIILAIAPAPSIASSGDHLYRISAAASWGLPKDHQSSPRSYRRMLSNSQSSKIRGYQSQLDVTASARSTFRHKICASSLRAESENAGTGNLRQPFVICVGDHIEQLFNTIAPDQRSRTRQDGRGSHCCDTVAIFDRGRWHVGYPVDR
jgi:hypothetical protein